MCLNQVSTCSFLSSPDVSGINTSHLINCQNRRQRAFVIRKANIPSRGSDTTLSQGHDFRRRNRKILIRQTTFTAIITGLKMFADFTKHKNYKEGIETDGIGRKDSILNRTIPRKLWRLVTAKTLFRDDSLTVRKSGPRTGGAEKTRPNKN